MRRSMLALLLISAALFPSPAQAAAKPAAQPILANCSYVYSINEFRHYASRVYQREHIGHKARKRLDRMHVCQHSHAARKWVRLWHRRYARERKARMCSDSNPVACIRDAANRYHVSFNWLLNCAKSESGLDVKVNNEEGSGAGGLFQFKPSTYYDALKRMGVRWKRWKSAKWQSRAAAFKFAHEGSGEWTGPGC